MMSVTAAGGRFLCGRHAAAAADVGIILVATVLEDTERACCVCVADALDQTMADRIVAEGWEAPMSHT